MWSWFGVWTTDPEIFVHLRCREVSKPTVDIRGFGGRRNGVADAFGRRLGVDEALQRRWDVAEDVATCPRSRWSGLQKLKSSGVVAAAWWLLLVAAATGGEMVELASCCSCQEASRGRDGR